MFEPTRTPIDIPFTFLLNATIAAVSSGRAVPSPISKTPSKLSSIPYEADILYAFVITKCALNNKNINPTTINATCFNRQDLVHL